MGETLMRFWLVPVHACLIIIGPLLLNRYFSVPGVICFNLLTWVVVCCFMFVMHPCILLDFGEPIPKRCFICKYAHTRCKLLKHWLFFTHSCILVACFAHQALEPLIDMSIIILLFTCGQYFFDVIFGTSLINAHNDQVWWIACN